MPKRLYLCTVIQITSPKLAAMKTPNAVLAIAMSLTFNFTVVQAQQSDELSRQLRAKVQEENNALTEMYLLYDNLPFTASVKWQEAEALQVHALNSAQSKKQFAGSVAELEKQSSETEIAVQHEGLEAQIRQSVKAEEIRLFQSYLNEQYIENIINGTCYQKEEVSENLKSGFSNLPVTKLESL